MTHVRHSCLSARPRRRRSGQKRQGLGLKIVGRIAEIHRGRFEWTRAPGVGVTATIGFARNA